VVEAGEAAPGLRFAGTGLKEAIANAAASALTAMTNGVCNFVARARAIVDRDADGSAGAQHPQNRKRRHNPLDVATCRSTTAASPPSFVFTLSLPLSPLTTGIGNKCDVCRTIA
jgi:hypothetical protein